MAPSVSLFSKLATKLTKPVIVLSKVPFVLASFKASAAPRPENSHSDEKDALFGLDAQMTIKPSYDICKHAKMTTVITLVSEMEQKLFDRFR
jgi:hypothetical protein